MADFHTTDNIIIPHRDMVSISLAVKGLKCEKFNTKCLRHKLYKKMYLAFLNGYPCGLNFLWHVDGVYSPILREILSDNALINTAGEYMLTDRGKRIVDCVNSYKNKIKECNLDMKAISFYQLIADVAYQYQIGTTKKRFCECHPWFTEYQVNFAYDFAKNELKLKERW